MQNLNKKEILQQLENVNQGILKKNWYIDK